MRLILLLPEENEELAANSELLLRQRRSSLSVVIHFVLLSLLHCGSLAAADRRRFCMLQRRLAGVLYTCYLFFVPEIQQK